MAQSSPNTNKSICDLQNDDSILKCLAAQSQTYSKAKAYKRTVNIATILYMLFAVFASWYDQEWSTATATLLAVSITVVTKYILIKVNTLKKTAASVQQHIDTKLYSNILNIDEEYWEYIPPHSVIAEAVSNTHLSCLDNFKNWYSDYSSLAPKEQVYRMQQENIRWDYELRKHYRIAMIFIAAMTAVAAISGLLVANPSFIRMICIFSWLIPIFDFYLCEIKDLNKSIKRLSNLKIQCKEVEQCIENNAYDSVLNKLYGIQNEIYKNRREGYLIPDWFYRFDKKKRQSKEDIIAIQISELNTNKS